MRSNLARAVRGIDDMGVSDYLFSQAKWVAQDPQCVWPAWQGQTKARELRGGATIKNSKLRCYGKQAARARQTWRQTAV